jgi:Niemann-Pick C1 protein
MTFSSYIKLMIFITLSLMSLNLWHGIQVGLDQRVFFPDNSHLISYYNSQEKYATTGPSVFFVIMGPHDMPYPQYERTLCSRFQDCSADSVTNVLEWARNHSHQTLIASTPTSWIDDFFLWLNPELDRCCRIDERTDQFCQANDTSETCRSCLTPTAYEDWPFHGARG